VVQLGEGFGFIQQDGGGQDVLAHCSTIAGNGFREVGEGQKGPQAENATPA
jgi:CspA family cold shock protein